MANLLENWVKKQAQIGNPVGLYATTGYLGNLNHIFYSPPFSDRLLFISQKKFISHFRNSNYSIIWKLHPDKRGKRPPPIEDGADNIFVVQDGLLPNLFKHVYFIVLDHPGTTLLQACTTELPIFCLLKHTNFLPEARELLYKRAVCSEDEDDLLDSIDKFALSFNYDADLYNKEYLKAYGGV